MKPTVFDSFVAGTVVCSGVMQALDRVPWVEHSEFRGVFLKNSVTMDHSAGIFSCHLVRIEAYCVIGMHAHPGSVELHEVIAGSGACCMGEEKIVYTPGVMAVIPCRQDHTVRAGADGLRMFAKFIAMPV